MDKKQSEQIRQFLDASQGAQDQPLHLALALDELAADASLDMRSNQLVGVELRRVRRQEEQLRLARLAVNELPHQLRLVVGVAVDHHED